MKPATPIGVWRDQQEARLKIFSWIALIVFVGFLFKKNKSKKKNEYAWSGLAESLFDRHDRETISELRLREILVQGSKKLGLRFGVIIKQGTEGLEILSHASEGYWPYSFRTGDTISRDTIFCGSLSNQRENISIDFASLTDWRKHPAYKDLGIESYIGHYLTDSGLPVTIAFFDSTPREQLFSRSDREFLKQLGTWVSSHLRGREMLNLAQAKSLQTNADSHTENTL